MDNDLNQPRKFDAVLGGKAPPPVNGVVLGGIEGVKHRLNSSNIEVQTAALSEAFNYGEACLDVITQTLQSPSALVRISAYSLLKSCSEPWAKQAIKDLGSYELFKCDRTFDAGLQHISSIALSLDSETLVCGGGNCRWGDAKPVPTIWNLSTGEQVSTVHPSYSSPIYRVAISPDGQRIVGLFLNSKIIVWDVKTGRQIYKLEREKITDSRIAIHPDGKTFFSTGRGLIKVWDLKSGREVSILNEHIGKTIGALCITANGKLLITGSSDGIIKVWDIDNRLQINEFGKDSHYIVSLAVSPNGETLVSGSDQRIKVWDLEKGQETLSFYGHADWVRSIVFAPENKTFISAGDSNIKVWNASTGEKIYYFKAHSEPICSLALSSDGRTLISGSSDSTVKVWRF